jgi:hypothetical protein
MGVTSISMRRILYAVSLAVEIVLLYYGICFLLLGYVPPKHRLIGSAVLFPLAALVSWWSGTLSLGMLSVERRGNAKIIKTFPVVLLLCVCLAATVFSIAVLIGVL